MWLVSLGATLVVVNMLVLGLIWIGALEVGPAFRWPGIQTLLIGVGLGCLIGWLRGKP